MNCELTKHQIDFYQTNGYLLIENFLNDNTENNKGIESIL